MSHNRTLLAKTVQCDSYGWYAEVYTDNDNASGDGDNAKVGRWYGTRAECEAVRAEDVDLHPFDATPGGGVDEFDLACERRHD